MNGTGSGLRTEDRETFVLDAIKEAMNGNARHGAYDDPEWIDTLADHAAYRSMDVDGIEEFEVADARREINELEAKGELRRVTHDFWTEDKVTLR